MNVCINLPHKIEYIQVIMTKIEIDTIQYNFKVNSVYKQENTEKMRKKDNGKVL